MTLGTHLSSKEPVDVLKHPQEQVTPLLPLLFRLFLDLESFLLSFRQERFELFQPLAKLPSVPLVLFGSLHVSLLFRK